MARRSVGYYYSGLAALEGMLRYSEREVEMNLRTRLPTCSVPLVLIGCLLCSLIWAAAAGSPRPPSPAGLCQAAQTSRTASPQSDDVESAPLFPVVDHGKWGYIDKTGKMVIQPAYLDAYPFDEGVAFVQTSSWDDLARNPFKRSWESRFIRLMGLIDKTGKQITAHDYAVIKPPYFSEGLAPVRIIRRFAFIDKTGTLVIPPGSTRYKDMTFEDASHFQEGLAAVRVHGKWGYIDKTGTMVISPQFSEAENFAEGLSPVKLGKKYGYIDKTGKMIIPAAYENAYMYTENLAAVKTGGKWGHIDKTGAMIIPPQFPDAYGFSEGLATVKTGGKWGYVDKTGTVVIPAQYEDALRHSEELAGVKLSGKWGYIDKTGTMVISPQFTRVFVFRDGLGAVWVGEKLGYVDHAGKYIWTPRD